MCDAEKGLVGQIYKALENGKAFRAYGYSLYSNYSSGANLQKIFETIMRYWLELSTGNFICSHI